MGKDTYGVAQATLREQAHCYNMEHGAPQLSKSSGSIARRRMPLRGRLHGDRLYDYGTDHHINDQFPPHSSITIRTHIDMR